MSNNSSVTIVIPAFREEANIEAAIDNAVQAVSTQTHDYEIIVVDDGSPDRTGEYARLKSLNNPRIRVSSNAINQGFGYSFAKGVKLASKDYITVFPGDNDMSSVSLRELIASRGGAELVITYMKKTDKRSLFRLFLSRMFVGLMNVVFGLRLKYYNGAFICKRELLQSIEIKSTGLAALAECIVRLLKAGHHYHAIYFEHTGRKHDTSKAISWRSLNTVARTISLLVKDIYFPSKKC